MSHWHPQAALSAALGLIWAACPVGAAQAPAGGEDPAAEPLAPIRAEAAPVQLESFADSDPRVGRWHPDPDHGWIPPATIYTLGLVGAAIDSQDDPYLSGAEWLQYSIPLAALAATYVEDDRRGRVQFLKAFTLSAGTAQLLKCTTGKPRPNYESERSFPSAHTAVAFSGASFLEWRYGDEYGLPAYLAATLVGLSRVYADQHYLDDVLAGASISHFSTWLFANPISEELALRPFTSEEGVGLELEFLGASRRTWREHFEQETLFEARYRYELEIDVARRRRNLIQSPAPGGTLWDNSEFDESYDPVLTASGRLQLFQQNDQELIFALSPFEVRDWGRFQEETHFGGQTFPQNTYTQTTYRLIELRGTWRTLAARWGGLDLRLGASLSGQWLDIEAYGGSWLPFGPVSVQDRTILPMPHLELRQELSDELSLAWTVDGIALGEQAFLDTALDLRYQINPHWDIALGARYWHKQIDSAELFNEFDTTMASLTLGYSW